MPDQPVDPAELRLALAANAVGTAVNASGEWLHPSVRRAVAAAVLDAIEPVTEHCIHSADMHQRYHQPNIPIPGCPWCGQSADQPDTITTGDRL